MSMQKVVVVSLANTKNQGGGAIGCLATHYSHDWLFGQSRPTIPLHTSHIPWHTSVWSGPTAVTHPKYF